MDLKEKLRRFFQWQNQFQVLPDECPLYAQSGFGTLYELIDPDMPITIGDLRKFVEEDNWKTYGMESGTW